MTPPLTFTTAFAGVWQQGFAQGEAAARPASGKAVGQVTFSRDAADHSAGRFGIGSFQTAQPRSNEEIPASGKRFSVFQNKCQVESRNGAILLLLLSPPCLWRKFRSFYPTDAASSAAQICCTSPQPFPARGSDSFSTDVFPSSIRKRNERSLPRHRGPQLTSRAQRCR